jgi:hypothetical protein
MPNVGLSVAPGPGFTDATTTVITTSDKASIVTFTTGTVIPGSGPYLIFTLTSGGSWVSVYSIPPAVHAFPCANPFNDRTAAQMAAVASLSPFFTIPNTAVTQAAVYCTNQPSASTAYDIGYTAIQGP